jgi:hypothetical protein
MRVSLESNRKGRYIPGVAQRGRELWVPRVDKARCGGLQGSLLPPLALCDRIAHQRRPPTISPPR